MCPARFMNMNVVIVDLDRRDLAKREVLVYKHARRLFEMKCVLS